MRSVFRRTGIHVPANVVDNHRLSVLMDTTDEWIQQRTGIVTRQFAETDQATSDLVCFVALGGGLSWGAALYRY